MKVTLYITLIFILSLSSVFAETNCSENPEVSECQTQGQDSTEDVEPTISFPTRPTVSKPPKILIKVEPAPCRDKVVAAQFSLGNLIDPDSFSISTFEELNLTIEQINALPVEEQAEIYKKITPMSVMVDQTLNAVDDYISKYSAGFYASFMADSLERMRAHKENLKICIYPEIQ